MAETSASGEVVVVVEAMPEAVNVVITEETAVVVEQPAEVVVVTVAEVGPPGPRGLQGIQGVPGEYDGAVADASPDPVLLFDNALI